MTSNGIVDGKNVSWITHDDTAFKATNRPPTMSRHDETIVRI